MFSTSNAGGILRAYYLSHQHFPKEKNKDLNGVLHRIYSSLDLTGRRTDDMNNSTKGYLKSAAQRLW